MYLMKKNLFKMIIIISCVFPTYTYADTNLKLARGAAKEWYQSMSDIFNDFLYRFNDSTEGDELNPNSPALPVLLYYENCKIKNTTFNEHTQVATTAVAKYLSNELSKNISPVQLWGHIRKDYCPNDREIEKPISLDELRESISQSTVYN